MSSSVVFSSLALCPFFYYAAFVFLFPLSLDAKDRWCRTTLGQNETQPSAPPSSVNKLQINLGSLIGNGLPGDFCVVLITRDVSGDVGSCSFIFFLFCPGNYGRKGGGGRKICSGKRMSVISFVRWGGFFLTFLQTLLCFGSVFKLILSW